MSGSVQTIERAAAIMRLLADSEHPLGVVQIANSLGLPKGTAHGLLKTLTQVGFVVQDPATSRYGPAPELQGIANSHVDPNQLRAQSMNYADTLAARARLAVRVGVLTGSTVRVVHHVFSPDRTTQQMDVGSDYPAHACALGKVLLAFRAGAELKSAQAGLAPRTAKTLITAELLARELAAIRQQGWASENEELRSGQAGIAAPIKAPGGLVIASIGVTGQPDRVLLADPRQRQNLIGQVGAVAESISAGIGGS